MAPRRVRRDPPTLDEAIFAAVGITDDQEQQAEIAAALMGMPYEAVLAEVKKHGRACARDGDPGDRGRTRRAALDRGRAPRRHAGSATTSAPAPEPLSIDNRIRSEGAPCSAPRSPPPSYILANSFHQARLKFIDRARRVQRRIDRKFREFACGCRRQIDCAGEFAVAEIPDARRTCWRAPASPHCRRPS